jgi:hypothetical protein
MLISVYRRKRPWRPMMVKSTNFDPARLVGE